MDIIPAVALGRIMQHVAGTLRWQTFLLSTLACTPAEGYEDFLRMMFVSVHWCRTAAGSDLQGSAKFWHILYSSNDFMTCKCRKLLVVRRIRWRHGSWLLFAPYFAGPCQAQTGWNENSCSACVVNFNTCATKQMRIHVQNLNVFLVILPRIGFNSVLNRCVCKCSWLESRLDCIFWWLVASPARVAQQQFKRMPAAGNVVRHHGSTWVLLFWHHLQILNVPLEPPSELQLGKTNWGNFSDSCTFRFRRGPWHAMIHDYPQCLNGCWTCLFLVLELQTAHCWNHHQKLQTWMVKRRYPLVNPIFWLAMNINELTYINLSG